MVNVFLSKTHIMFEIWKTTRPVNEKKVVTKVLKVSPAQTPIYLHKIYYLLGRQNSHYFTQILETEAMKFSTKTILRFQIYMIITIYIEYYSPSCKQLKNSTRRTKCFHINSWNPRDLFDISLHIQSQSFPGNRESSICFIILFYWI